MQFIYMMVLSALFILGPFSQRADSGLSQLSNSSHPIIVKTAAFAGLPFLKEGCKDPSDKKKTLSNVLSPTFVTVSGPIFKSQLFFSFTSFVCLPDVCRHFFLRGPPSSFLI